MQLCHWGHASPLADRENYFPAVLKSLESWRGTEASMRRWILIGTIALLLALVPRSGQAQVDDCKSRDPDVAVAGCTRVLQKAGLSAKDRANAYGFRGLAYAKKGMVDEAVADGTHAVEVDPRSAAAYIHRAYIFLRKPDNDRALADAERAPDRPQGRSCLSRPWYCDAATR